MCSGCARVTSRVSRWEKKEQQQKVGPKARNQSENKEGLKTPEPSNNPPRTLAQIGDQRAGRAAGTEEQTRQKAALSISDHYPGAASCRGAGEANGIMKSTHQSRRGSIISY